MSVTTNPPTIYLVNQISGHGHLDMYARLYSVAFLAIGYDVVLITQSRDGLGDLLEQSRGRFACYLREELGPIGEQQAAEAKASASGSRTSPSVAQKSIPATGPDLGGGKFRRIWREEGAVGVLKRVGVIVGYKFVVLANLMRTARARFIDFAVYVWAPLDRWLARGHISFVELVNEVCVAERHGGKKAALVYFLYLDMISDRPKSVSALAAMPAPWSGLLFHPRAKTGVPVERYFSCGNNRGCTFLNPDQAEAYRALMPGRTFLSLPDVTETEIEPGFELVTKLKTLARGRVIVLMIGSLSPHKGVMNFLEVVRLADAERYFFALIGEVFWPQYGDDEPKLRAFVASPPDNCFVRTEYIKGDRSVNAVIAASDVMFAVYKDFPNSSNSLNKAAIFEKPILVASGNLMARRVNEHSLGEAVPFGDPLAALAALDDLAKRERTAFGFAKYRAAHSLEALQHQLAAMVDGSLGRAEGVAAE